MVVARNFRSPKKLYKKFFFLLLGPLSSISGQWLQFGPGAARGPALPYSPLLQGPSHPNSTSLCWGLDPCEQFCLILSAKLQNYATVSLLRSLLYFAFARIIFPHF